MRRVGFWILLSVLPGPSPALEWTRVEAVPAADVFSLRRDGAVLYAGGRDVVHVGADGGTTWTTTTSVDPEAAGVESVLQAGGALWAGTYGRGVFRSVDGGSTWNALNAGLVGLGAQSIREMVAKEGRLYAGTDGAGVFLLDLATPTQWTSFNTGIPVSTAGGVRALVLHGTTLVAAAGGNGYVYRYPEAATAWEEVAVVPPILPGLEATDLFSQGQDLLFSSRNRVYRSVDDGRTWQFVGTGIPSGTRIVLTAAGPVFFAALSLAGDNHRVYRSADGLVSWQPIDEILGAAAYALESVGDRLFVARTDGLWWTPLSTTDVQSTTWGGVKRRFRR